MDERIVIGLGHVAQTGKDMVAEDLVENGGFVRLSTADIIRELCMEIDPVVDIFHPIRGETDWAYYSNVVAVMGAEQAKLSNPEVRRMQQRVGVGCRNVFGQDFWVRQMRERILQHERVVIPDVRFENEIGLVKGFGGRVFRIDRPGKEPLDHITDQALVDFDRWDGSILNDSSRSAARRRCRDLVDRFYPGEVDWAGEPSP